MHFKQATILLAALLIAGDLAGGSAVAESNTYGFEGVEPGPFAEFTSPLGTWTTESGTAIVDDKHAKTGKQCLQLTGDEKTSVVLKVADEVDTTGDLSFWAERWTAGKPFSFRIEKHTRDRWEEVFSGDKTVQVGRAFLSHVKVPLGDAKITQLRFTVTSPPNTGVLIDDVRIVPPTPQKITNVEVVPLTLPALVGNEACPLLKLKIETTGRLNPISLTQVQATLSGTTDRADLTTAAIHAGNRSQFLGSLQVSQRTGQDLTKGELTFASPDGLCQLREGVNYFWIVCKLNERANINHQVGAACQQVVFSNGETARFDLPPSIQRMGVALRNGGNDGAHTFRIPGLATTNEGTLIAVYDVRWRAGHDLPGDIDVGMSRSIDGGRTWQPMKVIMDMGDDPRWRYDGVGDPAVLVDRKTGTIWVAAIWSHGNRGWVGSGPGMKPDETGQLILVRSDDDGRTWAKPINITKQVKRPEWCFVLQGPGKGITMRNGTLVFAAQYQDSPKKGRLPHSTIIYSKDHGKTWQVGTGAFDDTTESQVVEVEPGVLMLNCRYNRAPVRVVMTTRDMGKSWQKHPTSELSLIEPGACMASLIDVDREVGKDVGGWLLFSNPDVSNAPRRRITIKASSDQGITWPKEHRLLLDEGFSAGYSCLTMIDDKTVGILYEGSQAQMTFQRLSLKDILGDTKSNASHEQGAWLPPSLELPYVFSDHMVLQADAPIPVWGKAKANAKIKVRLGEESLTATADSDGRWRVRFSPRRATSTPTSLVVKSAGKIVAIKDVLVGEVWVCAGQSNMEWQLDQSLNGQKELARLTKPEKETERLRPATLRLLDLTDAPRGITGSYSETQLARLSPDNYVSGQWTVADAESAKSFSAVGWYFGRHLQEHLKVPIGLICPAVGGSPTEAWIPDDALQSTPELKLILDGNWLGNQHLGEFCRLRGEQNLLRAIQAGEAVPGNELGPNHPFKPGFLWSAAIKPLIPYGIRGVLWYQGEANAETPQRVKQHSHLFPLLVEEWRAHWGQGAFPFLYVQLPAMSRPNWPSFREGQRRMLQQLENVGMATTIDTGNPTDVHPQLKQVIGKRLTSWALHHTYGKKDHPASGPLFADARFGGGRRVEISFDYAGHGLNSADGKPLRHFETAGTDGIFHPAKARIDGKRVIVEANHDELPQQVRYAWRAFPKPAVNLFNKTQLPASPFLARKPTLAWQSLPELPDEFGFGGPLVGTHNGALIVAGGANFPHGPPWAIGDQPAGSKVWHDRIFVLLPGEKAWRKAGRLPRHLAYAPVVSHATGMYILGGESFDKQRGNHDRAEVMQITWNNTKKRVEIDSSLPALPKASSYHAAAAIGDTIYVAASHAESRESLRLDTKALWSIDLGPSAQGHQWKSLPAWPGKPRFKMAMASAPFAEGDSAPRDNLYLFSGGTWVKNETGEHDLAKYEFYDDVLGFDPATNKWTQLASLPRLQESREVDTTGYAFERNTGTWRPLLDDEMQPEDDLHNLFDEHPRASAAAVAANDLSGRILLFSGSTGRYVTMAVKDRPAFPNEVLAYDIRSDRWTVAGRMPQGVVTTGAIWWQDRIVIASGELRPGVRTRRIQAVRVEE